jgi:hypothetical protein
MRALTLSFLFFAIGCGGSDDTSTTDPTDTGSSTADSTAGGDTKSDTATGDTVMGGDTKPGDTGGTTMDAAGVVCGSAVCDKTQVCCASGDPDSGFALTCVSGMMCPDGGAALKCDGPEDCPTGAGICCAEVNVEGTIPSCTFSSGVAECRATCNSMIPTMCPAKATVRRCHKKSECTESGYTKCCKFESGGTTAQFCANDTIALFAAECDTVP